jgi:DNA-binding transcriptional ArsR family regulator
MSVLADAGLVVRRRDGKWTYYSLPDTGGPVRDVLALVTTAAADDPDVVEDAARLTTLRCEGVING